MYFDLSNQRFSTLTDMGQYCKEHVIKLHEPYNAQTDVILLWTEDLCQQPDSELDCVQSNTPMCRMQKLCRLHTYIFIVHEGIFHLLRCFQIICTKPVSHSFMHTRKTSR